MTSRQRSKPTQPGGTVPSEFVWDAFLSYRHSTRDKQRARLLLGRLRGQGITVWFDDEQMRQPANLAKGIDEGLRRSRRLVHVLSGSSLGSNWCQGEMYALIGVDIKDDTSRVILVHYETIDDRHLNPLLYGRPRIDLREAGGFQRLVERLRQPVSRSDYCNVVSRRPITSEVFSAGPYPVEPPDLQSLVLAEVPFKSGYPNRPVRTSLPKTSWPEFVSILKTGTQGRLIFLIGEAGIGKTTVCRQLCRSLADGSLGRGFLPVYLSLGQWDPRSASVEQALDRELGFATVRQVLADAPSSSRVVLVLDGLNEQPPNLILPVLAFARRAVNEHHAVVLLTSRPVAPTAGVAAVDDARLFEIQRWTVQQLQAYFTGTDRRGLLTGVSPHMRDSLRLPLLAALFLRRRLQDSSSSNLGAGSDIFDYVVEQFMRWPPRSTQARVLGGRDLNHRLIRRSLGALALFMTEQRVVQVFGGALERCMPARSRRAFRQLLAHAVNSGILRCSRSAAAVDPTAAAAELRGLRVSFLHQTLQEYLTALHLRQLRGVALPSDVSHDAFWREVPVYLIRSLSGSVPRQRELVARFLDQGRPDYLTGARLMNQITEPRLRAEVLQQVMAALMHDIEQTDVYPYVIEAFRELGHQGIVALRRSIATADVLRGVYARAESHVIGKSCEGATEVRWRRAARAIYILGELGDIEVLDSGVRIRRIESLHLLYHIGEMLLTLCRDIGSEPRPRRVLSRACQDLLRSRRADEVVKTQAVSAAKLLGLRLGPRVRMVKRMVSFLDERAAPTNPHFREEFWRRAHGVEALAEIGRPSECAPVVMRLHEMEDRADYGDFADGSYRHVQSSIVKAVSRSCRMSPGSGYVWYPLLEAMFQSRRVAANSWACAMLETLLLRDFADSNGVGWLRTWRDSGSLGGDLIRRALTNVLWLTG